MLKHIPTHLIAGPLGAGKTTLLRELLAQRPETERWAVLINEFGQVGLDAALLTTDEDGVALGEVAGGCLCCVNGAPFQVGLGRLLRHAKPQRVFIEPSGLGHPQALLQQLQENPWREVLAVQPSVVVLDAAALAAGRPLPAAQQAALTDAGLLLLNKSESLDATARALLAAQLPPRPLRWTTQGRLSLADLPGITAVAGEGAAVELPTGAAPPPRYGSTPRSRCAKPTATRAAGVLGGVGIRRSVCRARRSRRGLRRYRGGAPNWFCRRKMASGTAPTRLMAHRWNGGAANGATIHG